jgi:hypothetical protein
MSPDGRPCGSIEVQVALAAGTIGADISLRLKGSQSNASYFVNLSGPSATPRIINGVPSDDYTYDVLVCDKMAIVSRSESGSPLHVNVLPDQTSILKIDLSAQRILDVAVRGELGLAYDGPLLLRVIDLPSKRVRHIEFAAAPYRIVGVGEGEYSISAMLNGGGSTAVGQEEFQTRAVVGPEPFQQVLLTSKFKVAAEVR